MKCSTLQEKIYILIIRGSIKKGKYILPYLLFPIDDFDVDLERESWALELALLLILLFETLLLPVFLEDTFLLLLSIIRYSFRVFSSICRKAKNIHKFGKVHGPVTILKQLTRKNIRCP